MTVSSFDHPFLSGFLGDEETAGVFSAKADLDAMLAFEAALAGAEGAAGVIPSDAATAIEDAIAGFRPDISALRDATARDGVVVPELVKQLRRAAGVHGDHVHFGATSQDVIDTGLALRLGKLLTLFAERLHTLDAALADLDERFGRLEVMAHTRMQAAIAVPASRKIASWRDPLARCGERLPGVRDDVAILHFGGAAGTQDKLGNKAGAVTEGLAQRLGLAVPQRARHSERDGIAGYASWLSVVTGSLGKIGQDIALMAQSEVGEIRLARGGGSSAMPHKVNPVSAEALVALARFNATLVAGMHQALVHENERSGAAWTLEWLILPQMTVATGAALRIAAELLAAISFSGRN
ncbi:MAG: 3-carboxy-cis,cis-muconate cycloisomerase [Rhizobiaceae bacterium]|nr:3-carboxy-cis,cis-muconate cycloisomerase [Rhizobiaceae bacterium]